MSMNDELRELWKQRQAKKQHRDENGKFAKKTVWDVAKELGLDTNDIRVRALAIEDVEDPQKAVLRLAAKMAYNQPDEADRASEEAHSFHFASRNEQLWDEYRRGSQNLTGNALIRFKQQMRAKGLKELH